MEVGSETPLKVWGNLSKPQLDLSPYICKKRPQPLSSHLHLVLGQ